MAKNTKQIIIAIIIIVIVFIVFKSKFTDSTPADVSMVAEQANSAQLIDGQVILSLLNKLEKVSLDESVFSNAVFVQLKSFERELKPQVPERKNPFLPIGAESFGVVTPRSTSTLVR